MDRRKQVWYDIYVGRLVKESRPFWLRWENTRYNRGEDTDFPVFEYHNLVMEEVQCLMSASN